MATLLEQWNLRRNPGNLKERTASAIAAVAIGVFAEDVNTANHANRIKWATASLIDPENWADRMFWGVIQNPTVSASGDATSDSDLLWVVGQLVNLFANTLA